MAEKKKGKGKMIVEVAGMLAGQAVSGVFGKITEEIGLLFVEIKKETLELQKKVTRRLFSSMLCFIGVLFLITAAILALVQLNLNPVWVFAIVGALLLLIGGCLQYIQNLQQMR